MTTQSLITISSKDILHQIKISCTLPAIVESILSRQIILQTAKQHAISITNEELQRAADGLRAVNRLHSADATWTWLNRHHLTLDDFEAMTEFTVLSGKLANHLFADQVDAYFAEHQLDYARVVLYEIILDDEDFATELFYAIQEGEITFYTAAHQYIHDLELRRKCGYLGALRRNDLKPELSAAVFAAKPSQLLKPIVTAQGAHLILVEDVLGGELTDNLRYEILSTLFSEWLKQQVEHAKAIAQINVSPKTNTAIDPLAMAHSESMSLTARR